MGSSKVFSDSSPEQVENGSRLFLLLFFGISQSN